MTNASYDNAAEHLTRDFHLTSVAVIARSSEAIALVAALRRRHVRAWGVLPEEALADVTPDVRAHCFAGELLDPLPRQYDLIVCLGALANLPQLDLERATTNLCDHAEMVLLSPSAAQPAEEWAMLFAQRDFFHAVYYDASFVAPDAMLFHKLRHPIANIVWAYERRQRELVEMIARYEQGRFVRLTRWLHAAGYRLAQAIRRTPPAPAPPSPAIDNSYAAWIAANEPGADELERQRQHHFAYNPCISLITPVFDPPPHALREAIESVIAQTYTNWEWCIADGGSSQAEIREILERAIQRDARIRVAWLGENLGITGNSNAALRMATGDFVLLFDHDDVLAPFALHEIVNKLDEDPALDIVCFDEDKITADGQIRLQPMFKPARWSPELMLSANYLMHSAVRRSLIEAVGGFDPDAEGAQDWDLLLRCTEQTSRIGHVAKVLYHWRMLPGSAATGLAAGKPWAVGVQPHVVANHLQRIGVPQPKAELIAPGYFRLIWPVREEKISIIIPTRDRLALLRRCLRSLLTLTAYRNFEVLVVDTGSTDQRVWDFYAELMSEPRVQVLHCEGTFNYSAVNNFGAYHAAGAHLLFLNNDVEALSPDWLEEMLRWSQRPEIGVVGAKLLYPEGTIQHAGIVLGLGHLFAGVPEGYNDSLFGGPNWYRNFSAVTGACLMTRREIFEQVGGFDEAYAVAFNDVDLCLRIAARGYRIVYTPFARLRHEEGATRANYVPWENHALAGQRMHTIFAQGDPFFNPNLDISSKVPHLRPPAKETS